MSTIETLMQDLYEGLGQIPVLDVHTHLVGERLAARGLHDILLYHMVVSDLYGAGCPSGNRLTEYPGWPTEQEAHARIQEALPYLKHIQGTSTFWGVRIILRDLYNWSEPITADNWRKLDATIRERADDAKWPRQVLDRANIRRTVAEYARRGNGAGDDRLQYSLEWGMFTRTQWGEYDTAVYELERAWGNPPQSPTPIGKRLPTQRTIKTLDDVHAAVEHYVNSFPYDLILSVATGISTDLDYTPPTREQMAAALKNRASATEHERNVYAAYIHEAYLTALEKKAGGRLVFQFSFAAEPLPFETASRVSQRTIGQVAEMIARHPKLHFQCFLASRHASQSLCTFCRELPNFSLAGYWWHSFFPGAIRHVLTERLDMVPTNKQMGYFSDAYVAEWSYAKLEIVKRQMAQVLAGKVLQGQYTRDEALAVSRAILYEAPQEVLGVKPYRAG